MSLLFLLTGLALADSPLTVPLLYRAQADNPLVVRALATSELDEEMMIRLSRRFTPMAERVALVNALGWSPEGQNNAVTYLSWLDGNHRRHNARQIALGEGIRADEAFVLGYLMAMDDYFNPQRALPLLEVARTSMPRSRSVAWVHTLTLAQAQMPADWCTMWTLAETVQADESLDNDLADEVEAEIISYLSLYTEYCPPDPDEEGTGSISEPEAPGSPATPSPQDPSQP